MTTRVVGFVSDDLSVARGQRGLPHPWCTSVADSIEGVLASAAAGGLKELGTRQMLESFSRSYIGVAEAYGGTGTPDLPPVGHASPASLKQRELLGPEIAGIQFGSGKQDPAGLLRLLLQITTQTRETADAIGHRGPMLSLKFELIQLRDAGTRTSTDSS